MESRRRRRGYGVDGEIQLIKIHEEYDSRRYRWKQEEKTEENIILYLLIYMFLEESLDWGLYFPVG